VEQTLSSSLTAWWKFIFPAVWISGFGAAALGLWLGVFRGRGHKPPPDWMRWQFLAMWLIGSAFLVWFSRRLHRVSIHDGVLTASNYFRTISVPLAAISRVRQSYLSNPQMISIYLDRQTGLGRKIVFVPRGRAHFLSEHPVTKALNEMIARPDATAPNTDVYGTPWANNPGPPI
jgi:hypothetical protein